MISQIRHKFVGPIKGFRLPTQYEENDVLFGKGGWIHKQSGNVLLRDEIKEQKESYARCRSTAVKQKIVAQVIQSGENMTPARKFWDKHDDGTWFQVTDNKRISEKIKQCLREKRKKKKTVKALRHATKADKKNNSPGNSPVVSMGSPTKSITAELLPPVDVVSNNNNNNLCGLFDPIKCDDFGLLKGSPALTVISEEEAGDAPVVTKCPEEAVSGNVEIDRDVLNPSPFFPENAISNVLVSKEDDEYHFDGQEMTKEFKERISGDNLLFGEERSLDEDIMNYPLYTLEDDISVSEMLLRKTRVDEWNDKMMNSESSIDDDD